MRRREAKRNVTDILRSARFTADEKICRMLERETGDRKEAILYLHGTLANQNKDDSSRMDAGKILEALDKKEAAKAYLDILKDEKDNIWIRCSAMTFFVRDKSFYEDPELLKKLIYALSPIASNTREEPETIVKQASATLAVIYNKPEDEIPRKTRELLAEYRDY